MAKNRNDLVRVKLSAKGEAFANGTPVRIVAGPSRVGGAYEFQPGETKEVTKALDWAVLSTQMIDGEPMFEVVTAAAKEKQDEGAA